MKVLSVNAGSSSLKFRLYEMPEEKLIMKGMFERIGLEKSCYSIKIDKKEEIEVVLKDHEAAVNILLKEIVDRGIVKSLNEIEAVGHRVVHGGNKYSKSVVVNSRVLKELEELSDLAPLHNPANIMGIKSFMKAMPKTKQVICFDTAFHQTISEENFLYPIPYEWYVKHNIRKYGFHGISHQYITHRMKGILNKDDVNLIICHIGNGASISAIANSLCIDTSMGFTPNAGIMMGTRSGDIDYSIISYVMKKENITVEDVDNILNKNSGLFAISGMSDLRDIDRAYESNESKAILSVNMYTNRIVEYVSKYFTKLNGKVDALVFTAGGGENDPLIREIVLKKLECLGIKVDVLKNNETISRMGKEGIISSSDSNILVYVVATDEELMIAKDAYNLSK